MTQNGKEIIMDCKHENQFLKTVNNRLFCTNCGAELPIEFLTAKDEPKPKKTKKKEKDA